MPDINQLRERLCHDCGHPFRQHVATSTKPPFDGRCWGMTGGLMCACKHPAPAPQSESLKVNRSEED